MKSILDRIVVEEFEVPAGKMRVYCGTGSPPREPVTGPADVRLDIRPAQRFVRKAAKLFFYATAWAAAALLVAAAVIGLQVISSMIVIGKWAIAFQLLRQLFQ